MQRYLEGRLFEWTMATSMILLGLMIFIGPGTILDPSFDLIRDVFPDWSIAVFLLVFGVARFCALTANGRSLVYGPRVRALCAGAGALLWGQLAYSLLLRWEDSIALPFWLTFVLAEIYSAYRAETDAHT